MLQLQKAPIDTPLNPDVRITVSAWLRWFTSLVRAVNAAAPVNGSATLVSAATVLVTLTTAQPDTNYRVTLTPNANETVWVTNKTTAGFTVHSSNATSTASVDWMLTR